jgi:hypothetical protein
VICHQVSNLLEVKIAHIRAISTLVARAKLECLLAVNSDLKRTIRQDLVSERLQTLCHTFLQLLVTKVKIQSIGNSGYGFGNIFAGVLDEVACDKFSFPVLAVPECGVVEDPDIVQSRVDGLGLLPSIGLYGELLYNGEPSSSVRLTGR